MATLDKGIPQPKYVYLLSTESYGNNGFIKIGVSCDYKKRISQIRKNVPFQITPITVIKCTNPLGVEKQVLRKFKSYRIKGEWFYPAPSLDIDCTKCSYADFRRDFSRQSKLLANKISAFLKTFSSEVVQDELL